jgi:ABC-type branched-subunit amino acid transport system substrate-binding protein
MTIIARRAVLAAAVLGMLGPVSAQAENAPGISDKEIVLGGVFALSGQFRLVTEPYERGLRAVFNATNDAGGIHGRKIRWILEDDAYQPARALAGARKLVERDHVFAIVGQVGTPNIAAILPYTEPAKVPVVTINPLPVGQHKSAFNIMASFSDLSYHLTKYLLTKGGVKKLGYLYQNDALGEVGRVGVNKALKELGAKLTADVGYERGATDLNTQVLKLRDAGVEAVVVIATAPAVATAVKQSNTIDFKPTWATLGVIGTDIVYKLLGKQTEGLMFASEVESQFAESPGIKSALATVRKYFPDSIVDYNMLIGYANGVLAVKALEMAGPNPTREKFVAAIESLSSFDSGVVKLSFSATKHGGADAAKIFQWKGGKPVALTDWLPISGGRQ